MRTVTFCKYRCGICGKNLQTRSAHDQHKRTMHNALKTKKKGEEKKLKKKEIAVAPLKHDNGSTKSDDHDNDNNDYNTYTEFEDNTADNTTDNTADNTTDNTIDWAKYESDMAVHNTNVEYLRGSTLNPDPGLIPPKPEDYKRKHNFEESTAKKPGMMESSDTEEKEPPQKPESHHPKCECENCSEYRYKVKYHAS